MVKHRKALFLSNTVTETYDAESTPEMMDIDVEDNGWQDAVEDRGYIDPSADERNSQPSLSLNIIGKAGPYALREWKQR